MADTLPPLDDILAEYSFLEPDERYRLLIDLGRGLPPRLGVGLEGAAA